MKTTILTLAIALAFSFTATPADALNDLAKCRVYNAKIKMNYAKCLELDKLLVEKGKAPKGICESKRTTSLDKATAKFVDKLGVSAEDCGIDSATTDEAGLGRFFQPTLLADCDHSMDIMVEESFGPVLGICKVKDDDEAVQKMNDSQYGLSACVFTKDHARAEALSKVVNTGTFFQNRCDYLDPMLAWTGVKNTGKGVSLSHHGFRGVTRLRNFHAKLHASA